jgi:cyanophycinase-like exopeptidase
VSPGASPRLLVIMGSGETSPTMAATHRELFGRLGQDVAAVLLETPYAFQENAAEISAKARRYFGDSVGRRVEILSDLGTETDAMAAETALARLRAARWTFAGPGSPSYALARWHHTQVPSALADLLQRGGCAVFASAAACTIGTRTLPVYEIYKVGQPPTWLEGLDLVAAAGLRVAVIPHYNNAEGGTHDTRYCYMGERRLRQLEDQLADHTAILGVDEHTAAVLDLDAQVLTVSGRGGVTLRHRGRQWTWPSGATVTLDELRRAAAGSGGAGGPAAQPPASHRADTAAAPEEEPIPLLPQVVDSSAAAFDRALERRDAAGMVAAILAIDHAIVAWSADTLQSDDVDRAHSMLRSLVVRLGEAAATGLRDPGEALAPIVEPLVGLRASLRDDGRYELADAVRDALAAAHVELRDQPGSTIWRVRGTSS